MKIDANEIVGALRMIFCRDDVFEIRVLNACLNGAYGYTRKEHSESGFFKYDEIDKVPGALEVYHSASGVYFTPNPLVPLIYSKCGGRIEDAKRHGAAADKHVLRRRWFLVDCDARHVMDGVEVTGISSSEPEHQYAIETAYEIADHLRQQLFSDPVILDSGNGCSLMYAIDIPPDEKNTEMVQYVLKYLSRFDNEHVKVDQSVFNPSRIWRLPGTMNCKGDASEDRPHRMARILGAEREYEVTATEHLERLAGIAYEGEHPSSVVNFQNTSEFQNIKFNLENWIQKFCPDAKPPVAWNGGRKWILPVCPFNADHDNFGCAAIFETADGKPGFECRHDGCRDNHWKELRTLLDEEYRTRGARQTEDRFDGVDIDGIAGPAMHAPAPEPDELSAEEVKRIDDEEARNDAPWRSVTDQDVRTAIDGTLLGKLNDIYANVTIPRLPIAASLLKAIVTLGCCISGEATAEELEKRFNGNLGPAYLSGVDRAKLVINTGGGAFCNFYAILIGNSNSGKDIGRLIEAFANFPNPSAKTEDGETLNYLVGTSGSAEGIADGLMVKPNGLLVISELQNWLDEKHWMHSAMNFLTDAWDKGYFDYAMSKRMSSRRRATSYCSPSAIANIQPEIFNRYATPALIESGNFGRWLIACMPNKEGERFYGTPNNFDRPEALIRIKEISDIYQRKHGIVDVPQDYSLSLKQMFANKTETILDATWGRLINQYYPRLAILLSVTDDDATQGEDVVLSQDAWARARTLVMWFFANAERTLRKVKEKDESAFTRDWENSLRKICRLVCRYYRKTQKAVGKKAIAQANVKYSGGSFSSKQREMLLQELLDRGILKMNGRAYEPDNIPEDWEI